MKFVKKSTEELEKMTSAELDQYKNDLEASNKAELKAELSAENKNELEKATNELKEFMSTEIGKQLLDVTSKNEVAKDELKSFLLDNKSKIEEMKTNPNASLNLVVKANEMTFATVVTGNVGRTERDTERYRELKRVPTLLNTLNVSTTDAKHYEWIETTDLDNGVAMTAEGAVKPNTKWNKELFSQSPKKMAVVVTISKELLDDVDGMLAEINEQIEEQNRLFLEEAVYSGDGTGINIAGFEANATPFVAGAFAASVVNPNNADCIRIGINQIALNNDYPNRIYMHPTDATKMELEKDPTTSQYVLPPFTNAEGTQVKGLPVTVSTVITEGEAFVGNFNRFKVKIRESLNMQMGYRGTEGDWEKNMVSFIGEQRAFAFIPAVHYGSIVKIDFAVAKGLIEKP